jgi:O-antigen/teichoic acid export membrane protein
LWRWAQTHLHAGPYRKGLESLVDQASVSGTNWLTAAIVARLCSPGELGVYVLGYSVLLVVAEIQASLVSHPYTVFSSRLVGRANALYTGSSLAYQAVLAGIAVLAVAVAALVSGKGWGPQGLSGVLAALAVVLPAALLREHVRRICFAKLYTGRALAVDGLASITQLSLLVLIAARHQLSARSAFWSVGVGSAVAVVMWLGVWRSEFAFDGRDARAGVKGVWSFGKWILGGNMASLLSQQLFPWFLAWTWGTAATGALAACTGLIAVSNPLVFGAGNLLGPMTAQACAKGRTTLRSVVVRATVFTGSIAAVCWILIALLGGKAVVAIYGEQYRGHGWSLTVLALGSAVSAAFLAAGFGTWALGRSDVNCLINVGALAGTLTLGLWLVRAFGLPGVGYGLLVANAFAAIGRWVAFERLIAPERS